MKTDGAILNNIQDIIIRDNVTETSVNRSPHDTPMQPQGGDGGIAAVHSQPRG
jgi:hypothetical protein